MAMKPSKKSTPKKSLATKKSARRFKATPKGTKDRQHLSIGWLAWHLSRWKDRFSARVSGPPQVWVSEGWAERFGMDAEATGLGDTPEQVAAFRPDRALLFGYVDAAHRATVERVKAMTDEDLVRPYQYGQSQEPRPAWRGLTGVIMDFTQHTGQIAYLRGLITGFGWRG